MFCSYLWDRLAFIVLYYFHLFLIVLVVELVMRQQERTLGIGNVLYLFLLSTFFLLLFYTVDYLRQRPFRKRVEEAFRQPALDLAVHLGRPITREQIVFQNLLERHYQLYKAELSRLQERQQLHLDLMNQWAHTMKTPVSVLYLLVQQSQNAHSQEMYRELFDNVEKEYERLAHGLEMMLHLARLEKFSWDLLPRRVELLGLLRSVINEERTLWIRYRLYPRLIAEQGEVFVETDPKWIRFVFQQLIHNAIKYSRLAVKVDEDRSLKGIGALSLADIGDDEDSMAGDEDREGEMARKTVTIAVRKMPDGVEVQVTDEGIGIPEQDLGRIFEPFFTGENGRRTRQSTGMGLYLAKQVCQRLGHDITVESEVGRGTTFTVRFSSRTLHQRALR